MKRVFALILALCMACALFACGKKQTEVAPGGDSPTVTPGATDPGSGPAENPGGSTGVPGDLFFLHRQHPDGGRAHPGHDRGGPV